MYAHRLYRDLHQLLNDRIKDLSRHNTSTIPQYNLIHYLDRLQVKYLRNILHFDRSFPTLDVCTF